MLEQATVLPMRSPCRPPHGPRAAMARSAPGKPAEGPGHPIPCPCVPAHAPFRCDGFLCDGVRCDGIRCGGFRLSPIRH